MTADIVNLRQVRKTHVRRLKEQTALEYRVKHAAEKKSHKSKIATPLGKKGGLPNISPNAKSLRIDNLLDFPLHKTKNPEKKKNDSGNV